jgi:hypothetical protein
MRVIEHLVKTLRDSAIFNPEVQAAPACILWPDKDRQWESHQHLTLAEKRAARNLP